MNGYNKEYFAQLSNIIKYIIFFHRRWWHEAERERAEHNPRRQEEKEEGEKAEWIQVRDENEEDGEEFAAFQIVEVINYLQFMQFHVNYEDLVLHLEIIAG